MNDEQILRWMSSHYIVVFAWVLLLMINSMPTPKDHGPAYKWLFNVLHVLGAGPMRIARIRKAVAKVIETLLHDGEE